MAQNTPSWAKGLPNYTLYDKYDVARSGLIDTAETPQDKKRLKQDLQKLRQEYLALKAAQAKATPKATPKATSKNVSNGSDTKPYNVKLMTPRELVGGKEPKASKSIPAKEKNKVTETIKKVTGKAKAAAGVMPTATKKTQTKSPMKPGTNPKITGSASSKPQVSASMTKSQPKTTAKSKPLTGAEAIKAIQNRTSPSGVKKAEAGAKKAIDKKYPGLYKKSK